MLLPKRLLAHNVYLYLHIIYVYTPTYTYMHVYVWMNMCKYDHMHVYIYIYIYIRTFTHRSIVFFAFGTRAYKYLNGTLDHMAGLQQSTSGLKLGKHM